MKKLKNKKGFTLMEMLIVIAIIVILVAIAIPTFSNALTKAKIATDEANVRAWYAEQMAAYLLEDTAFPATYGGNACEAGVVTITTTTMTYTPKDTDFDAVSWDLPAVTLG